MDTYVVNGVAYTVGDTVRYTHKRYEIGTILDVADDRLPWIRRQNPQGVHSIRVAFPGHDRPTILPLHWLALVPNMPEEKLDMWQLEMDEISEKTAVATRAYDNAPDGSRAKQRAMEQMDHLSKRRRFVEQVFDILVPLVP